MAGMEIKGAEMNNIQELAEAITRELNERYLQIEGEDYRHLYVERKINLAALAELEKQLADAKSRIAELEKKLATKEIEYTDLWNNIPPMQAHFDKMYRFVETLMYLGEDLDMVLSTISHKIYPEQVVWRAKVAKWRKEREEQ